MEKTNLLDIPQVTSWLRQFSHADRYIAIRLLLSLKYVSFENFEAYIQSGIKGLVDEIGEKRPLALFTVDKRTKQDPEKEIKLLNDSAGRIGHALRNLERQVPKRVELSPRKSSMVSNRVNHIVFVDDFIGSGDRFIGFWRHSVPKYLKSWVSRGWCKIWVVSYAAHAKGIKKIVRNVSCLTKESFISNIVIEKSPILGDDVLTELLNSYCQNTNKPAAGLGYGKYAIPIIFQHGCPNNAPGILWASGGKKWLPLFPDRGIPPELYPLFTADLSAQNLSEVLWSAGQYHLAASFLEQVDFPRRSPGTFTILTILGLLSKGKSIGNIRKVLLVSDAEFDHHVKELLKFQLCDSSFQVTAFGKDVLDRSKGVKYEKSLDMPYEIYYPATFMGLQREV